MDKDCVILENLHVTSFLFSPLMLKRDSGGGSLVHQLFDIKLPHCFNITDVRYCSEAYWLSSEIKRPYFFDGKQPTGDSVAFSLYMRPRFTKHVCSARAGFTRTTKCSQNLKKSKIPFSFLKGKHWVSFSVNLSHPRDLGNVLSTARCHC